VRPRRLLAAVFLATGLAAAAARAETAPPAIDPATLTLAEAVALARIHAPTLQEARAKVALARLDVRATRWWTWLIPSVSASPGYDFLAGQERASVALSLDLTKLLGQGAREAERADLALAQAERAVEIAEAAVVEAVTRAYFALVAIRATVEVRTAAIADALKLEALEAIRFAHGTGDLAPLLHARATLARARLDRLTAEQEAQLAALALRRAIGLPLP
jgi:outer membrane protein TolC